MKNKERTTDIQSAVLEQIRSGSVHMRPRSYFVALWSLGIAASVGASLSIAYIISILMFAIRIQTASTPAYGARANLSTTLSGFPWWAVGATIILLIIATWLNKQYSHLYRYKGSYLAVLFISASLLIGIVFWALGIGNHSQTNLAPTSRGQGMHRLK